MFVIDACITVIDFSSVSWHFQRLTVRFEFFLCFSYYAREFIEKIPEKRLTSQKMDCIHNMVKTKLFEDQGRLPLQFSAWVRDVEPLLSVDH